MLLALLACLGPGEAPREPAPTSTPEGHPLHHAEGPDPNALRALPLPAELPFRARTRTNPCSLVDAHGQVSRVLEAVGVEVEVTRLLPTRALVSCVGCREPVEAWVQRQALFVGTEVGEGPDDPLLAWLEAQPELPAEAAAGFVERGEGWVAPPWFEEEGFAGARVLVSAVDGGYTLHTESP